MYDKPIKTIPENKLEEDTMAKKQVSWIFWTHSKVSLSRCAAGKN